MIAFKLTNKKCASWGFHECSPGYTKYVFGKWTKPKPKFGPLAVFRDYSDLKNFKKNSIFDFTGCREFVCEIKKSKAKKLWFILSETNGPYTGIGELPHGTVFARAVKLIKEIK